MMSDSSAGFSASVDFRAILEMSGVPIVQVDLSTQRIRLLNDAFCRMLGYERDELLGRSVLEFTHADDRAGSAAEMRRLADRVIPQLDLEKRYLRKDGSICWVHVCARLASAPGEPPLTVAVLQDVTARRASEASLVETNRRLTDTLESISDGFVSLDRDWRYTYVNDTAGRLLGVSRDVLIGRALWDMFPAAASSTFWQECHRAVDEACPVTVEAFYPAPLEKWFECRCYPSPDGLAIFFTDVTARHHETAAVEDARRRAEAALSQLHAVVDSLPEAIVIADAGGRVLHHNASAVELFGLFEPEDLRRPGAELAGRWPMYDLDDRLVPFDQRPLQRALRGERFDNYELLVRDAETGREVIGSYSGSAIHDETGRLTLAIVSTRDITERKRAEQEVARQLAEITAIYDSAPVGLCVLDRNLRYLRVNERLAVISGPRPASDYPGRTVEEMLPELSPVVTPAFRELLESGQPRLDVEVVGETPAQPGVQRTWIEQWLPLRDAQGQVVGISVVADEVTERKRADVEREQLIAELQRQRDFLGKLFERLPVGVAVVAGPELHIEFVNAACQEMSGARDPLTGRSIRELFSAAQPGTFEHLSREVMHGRPWEFHELEWRLPAGQRWWSGWAVPLSATAGTDPSALLIVQDMTATVVARRSAEQLAREAEGNLAQLQAVVNSMTEGLTIADPSGYVVSMNAAALRIHGFETVEQARRHLIEYPQVFDVRTLDDEPIPVSEWPTSLALGGRTFSGLELLVRRLDTGRTCVASYGGAPVRDRHGRVLLGINTVRDITEERRATIALGQSERRYRTLVNAAPVFVWHLDPDGRFTYSSGQFLRYVGVAGHEATAWTVGDNAFVHPDEQPLLVSRWREGVEQGSAFELEARLRRADGTYRWHLTRCAPMTDDEQHVAGWVAVSVDIDERKQAEERLREADRLKDQFLVVLSHEMRQPLNALRAASQVARIYAETTAIMRPLEIVDRQVMHLAHLVDDLTDASRVKRGRLLLQRTPCDLRHVVTAAIESVRPMLALDGLALDLDLPVDPVPVLGDPNRLNQVLLNLLSNAAKHTPAEGRVEVRLSADGRDAVLQVRDTGRGIEPDLLPRVFELFVQGSNAETSGMGIGLALVKGLVELHEGTVDAASPGPGQGSAFTVRLPLATEAGPTGPTGHAAPA